MSRLIIICEMFFLGVLIFFLSQCSTGENFEISAHQKKISLGKIIFHDNTLSVPVGQSCASCHDPKKGFSDPNEFAISPGAVISLFGNRNAPPIGYNIFSPRRYYDDFDSTFVGGIFWDGRVHTLKEQIKKTLFNPLEMNNTSLSELAIKIKRSKFYSLLVEIYGITNEPEQLIDDIADAIVAYEKSNEVNSFSSKFDFYLNGKAKLTSQEKEGFELFKDENKGKCANCHLVEKDKRVGKILFTDFTYDNIGVPRNENNPFYLVSSVHNPDGKHYVDMGLGAITGSQDQLGQFKVPTLRNIALTAPYFHNGVFKSLDEVVHFYNKRDVDVSISHPEYTKNVNREELGDLKLTKKEEKAIVAFLKTLSDGYKK